MQHGSWGQPCMHGPHLWDTGVRRSYICRRSLSSLWLSKLCQGDAWEDGHRILCTLVTAHIHNIIIILLYTYANTSLSQISHFEFDAQP